MRRAQCYATICTGSKSTAAACRLQRSTSRSRRGVSAGGPVNLPVPHIAWVGAPPPLPKTEFIALANGDDELERGLAALHGLFRQAPLLGSLIELSAAISSIRPASPVLTGASRHWSKRCAAPSLSAPKARSLRAVWPTLRRFWHGASRCRQQIRRSLAEGDKWLGCHYLKAHVRAAKADLGNCHVTRMRELAARSGTVASVTPQNWLFLGPYKKMREKVLASASLEFVAVLGEHGFDSPAAAGAFTALVVLTETKPNASSTFAGLDANDASDPARKAAELYAGDVRVLKQNKQRANPDCRIGISEVSR